MMDVEEKTNTSLILSSCWNIWQNVGLVQINEYSLVNKIKSPPNTPLCVWILKHWYYLLLNTLFTANVVIHDLINNKMFYLSNFMNRLFRLRLGDSLFKILYPQVALLKQDTLFTINLFSPWVKRCSPSVPSKNKFESRGYGSVGDKVPIVLARLATV